MSTFTGQTGLLVLSVGGSRAPLAHSIRSRKPRRVVFVVSECSQDNAGSRSMVEGKDGEPGLIDLPDCPGDTSVLEVPADNLDVALARIDAMLSEEISAGFRPVIDYTGGTKSMTAAIVLAAAAHAETRLQFMAGQRSDLSRVKDGTETPVEMPKDMLGIGQAFETARDMVARNQYGPARDVITMLERRSPIATLSCIPRGWRLRMDDWQAWLEVFACWDRFEHAAAWAALKSALDVGATWAEALEADGWAGRLEALVAAGQQPDPLLVEDLWLNAERRAVNGLFDDAIARLYRIGEAGAQARLLHLHNVDATCCPVSELVAMFGENVLKNMKLRRFTREGTDLVSLTGEQARALLLRLNPDDTLALAWREESGRRNPRWQQLRNRSILAHGFRPLTEDDWLKARKWFDALRGPLWEDLLGRTTAAQLPDRLPEIAP